MFLSLKRVVSKVQCTKHDHLYTRLCSMYNLSVLRCKYNLITEFAIVSKRITPIISILRDSNYCSYKLPNRLMSTKFWSDSISKIFGDFIGCIIICVLFWHDLTDFVNVYSNDFSSVWHSLKLWTPHWNCDFL